MFVLKKNSVKKIDDTESACVGAVPGSGKQAFLILLQIKQ